MKRRNTNFINNMNPGASIIISTIGIAAGVVVLAVGGIYYFMNRRNRNKQYAYGNYDSFYPHQHRSSPNIERFATNQRNTECIICLDTLEVDQENRTISCGHTFHLHCIKTWCRVSDRRCPICRREIMSLI